MDINFALPKLLFQNPVFNEGANLTCRKGIKWGTTQIGDRLKVVETGKEDVTLGIATVTDVKVIPFDMIPEYLLENEHDPSCRTWDGLFAGMQTVYPTFYESEIITMVFFNFAKS